MHNSVFIISIVLDLMLWFHGNSQKKVTLANGSVIDRPVLALPPKSKEVGLSQFLRTNFARTNSVRISKNKHIPWIKGNIWIVLNGYIKLRALKNNGEELTLGFLGPNQIFGEPFSLIDECDPYALVDSKLVNLPLKEAYKSPSMAIAIMESLSLRNRYTELSMAVLAEKKVKEKVKAFLELIATDLGKPVGEGLMIDFKITHQDIANAIGSTRVTITRILAELQEDFWLKKTDGGFLVIAF